MSSMHDEFEELLNDLCHTEDKCGSCLMRRCLIGHSKYVNKACKDLKPPHLAGASESRPLYDLRGNYDEDEVLRVLATTLVYCKACKDNHTDDCVLAVIRNNLEMLELTQEIEYKGNPLTYLVDFSQENPTKGAALAEIYNLEKEKVR